MEPSLEEESVRFLEVRETEALPSGTQPAKVSSLASEEERTRLALLLLLRLGTSDSESVSIGRCGDLTVISPSMAEVSSVRVSDGEDFAALGEAEAVEGVLGPPSGPFPAFGGMGENAQLSLQRTGSCHRAKLPQG